MDKRFRLYSRAVRYSPMALWRKRVLAYSRRNGKPLSGLPNYNYDFRFFGRARGGPLNLYSGGTDETLS